MKNKSDKERKGNHVTEEENGNRIKIEVEKDGKREEGNFLANTDKMRSKREGSG